VIWSDPLPLSEYRRAPAVVGLYIIGSPFNEATPPTPSGQNDDYLGGNFPNNFRSEYIGISEFPRSGVRGRLSKHARKVGSKCIAELLMRGRKLYFITCPDEVTAASLERVMLCLQGPGQFECNVRKDYLRNPSSVHEEIHRKMGGKPFTPIPRTWEGDGM
jgi:hypothetical protein